MIRFLGLWRLRRTWWDVLGRVERGESEKERFGRGI